MLSGLEDLSSLTIHLYVYFIDFLKMLFIDFFFFGGGSNEEEKNVKKKKNPDSICLKDFRICLTVFPNYFLEFSVGLIVIG